MKKWIQNSLLVLTALLFVSGLGLIVCRFFLRSNDPFSAINHPLQPWLLKFHLLIIPLWLTSLGGWLVIHIAPRLLSYKADRRRSGISTVALIVPMVFSGFLMQVITHETTLTALLWVHMVCSILFTVIMVAHLRVRRRALQTDETVQRVA